MDIKYLFLFLILLFSCSEKKNNRHESISTDEKTWSDTILYSADGNLFNVGYFIMGRIKRAEIPQNTAGYNIYVDAINASLLNEIISIKINGRNDFTIEFLKEKDTVVYHGKFGDTLLTPEINLVCTWRDSIDEETIGMLRDVDYQFKVYEAEK